MYLSEGCGDPSCTSAMVGQAVLDEGELLDGQGWISTWLPLSCKTACSIFAEAAKAAIIMGGPPGGVGLPPSGDAGGGSRGGAAGGGGSPAAGAASGSPAPLAQPQFPVNFPATKGELMSLTGPAVNALLTQYNLSTAGPVKDRKNRLAEYIGMRVPIV